MFLANAHIQCTDKFFGKISIDHGIGCHYKFNAITGSQIENFRNVKKCLNFSKFVSKVFLADHQFPKFFQLDLLVRKSNNF